MLACRLIIVLLQMNDGVSKKYLTGLLMIRLSLYGGFILKALKKQLFVAFPLVVTSTGPGGFMICVFII